jgi:very-short-patch-repair endonuclease
MSMNFGPLNKEGGWRRLNVAITRARREMLVFSSFDASMVDLNRTNARAVRDLKHFIEFAQRGPRALAEAVQGSVGGYDSPFEEAVAQGLRRKGWQVVPQIGVSRFRIDLGIVHPDRPGDYLVGVECDGATYHSAATARDRDKVRSAILKGLGWKLVRLWSTEWWIDKSGALDRLDLSFVFTLNMSAKISAAKKAIQLIAEYREIEQSLSLRYAPEACRIINFEQVKSDWDVAKGKFWILATFGKKKVAKTLASVGGATPAMSG